MPGWSVDSVLGEGSYGKVFKIKREFFGDVSYSALKMIQLPADKSEIRELQQAGMNEAEIYSYYVDVVKSLLQEIKVMQSLKSAANVVSIEDYMVVEGKDKKSWIIFIKMELLESLPNRLKEYWMPEIEVVKMGMDVCSALIACETLNIIHRDIKLDNIFLNEFGSYKLGDFGIARKLEGSSNMTSQQGTNMYMAPEVARGEQYDCRVDIYSLGILMYRLVNDARFPFMPLAPNPIKFSDKEAAEEMRLAGNQIPRLESVNKRLMNIILKATQFDKENRYSDAREMYNDLRLYFYDVEVAHDSEAHTSGESANDGAGVAEQYLSEPTITDKRVYKSTPPIPNGDVDDINDLVNTLKSLDNQKRNLSFFRKRKTNSGDDNKSNGGSSDNKEGRWWKL